MGIDLKKVWHRSSQHKNFIVECHSVELGQYHALKLTIRLFLQESDSIHDLEVLSLVHNKNCKASPWSRVPIFRTLQLIEQPLSFRRLTHYNINRRIHMVLFVKKKTQIWIKNNFKCICFCSLLIIQFCPFTSRLNNIPLPRVTSIDIHNI